MLNTIENFEPIIDFDVIRGKPRLNVFDNNFISWKYYTKFCLLFVSASLLVDHGRTSLSLSPASSSPDLIPNF